MNNKIKATPPKNVPLIAVLDYGIFIFGICSQVFVQLLSTLAAQYALQIFEETQSLEWTIAISLLTITILWVGKIVTGNMTPIS